MTINLGDFANRLIYVSGLIFTTLAYQIIISSSIPKVSYSTTSDFYTMFLFAFMVSELFIVFFIPHRLKKHEFVQEKIVKLEGLVEISMASILLIGTLIFIILFVL